MKQIAQYQDGRLEIQEVPVPTPPPGGVLIRTTHSVISVGTEKMKVQQAKMNLLQKARARPDQVRKVMEVARNLGWKSALEKVRNRLESPTPLGYSAAGVVVAVDPANGRFQVGDRVACGGAECAFHAEYIAVPDMLVARVPEAVPNWQAAYTTLCSIAMQAVRQTEPSLGDRVMVMGQGLIGLLITNLLATNGVRVMGVDLQMSRRSYMEAVGAERTVILGSQTLADEVRTWTDGYGVDAVVVCTASQSNTPIEQAAESLRDRGRIVDVGITKIELPWKTFAEKELDVRFSRSYGPGRYDLNYEWGGHDYPIGYVRWTEQRNFDAVLHLMGTGGLKLEALTTRRLPFADAQAVYKELEQDSSRDIGVVLEYETGDKIAPDIKGTAQSTRKPAAPAARTERLSAPAAGLDIIGAGNFAKTMLLPHLKGALPFGTVVNQTALSARHVQTKFGFAQASADAQQALAASSKNALIIATRHNLHAPFTISGLQANRHLFVEKPLCLTEEELTSIDEAYAAGKGTIQVGFNRRFAPASVELRKALANIPGPKSASYRVFAGKLDPQHWFANVAESGGRVLGETCHYFDWFCYIFGSKPVQVTAQTTWPVAGRTSAADSVAVQVQFADGSAGQLVYSAEGDSSYPKESITVFAAGLVADIVNFQQLRIHRGRAVKKHSYMSKGHAEQMQAWSAFLRGQSDHPFPYNESRASMVLTFAVMRALREGTCVSVDL